jgi:Fur family ferric uptake transcriptional regulator
MDSNVLDRVRESLQAFLSSKGLRRTVQREAIIDAAFGTNEHFTAEELLTMARRLERSVSRATVYRTLPLLVKSGLLHELDLGSDTKIYDPNFVERPTHNHLICVDCDRIIEFEDVNMELLENCITRRLGFSPANKAVKIEGHCDELKLKGSCRNQRPKA